MSPLRIVLIAAASLPIVYVAGTAIGVALCERNLRRTAGLT